ncbi:MULTISPECIES: cell division protein FtsB [Oceanimonas]|uniref:Cell division protein FtsB n=1 Tax=Oceanimonas doudoroffii TaxID=84158 RepID=A0A233RJG9_9GAMM|nr:MULTISPECIES: cell division protein FtsB [Oceanimonas]NHH99868.1 Cell division protein FtsB [Oceanimonas sp. MB9]OXY83542.1 cell division protein FtsB [Oceanimonas doudoroffii]
MRTLTLILLALLGTLQYHLWWGKNGLGEYHEAAANVSRQLEDNQRLADRNALLYRDIEDLNNGLAAVEELARNDLGMIKPGETFYRLLLSQDKP